MINDSPIKQFAENRHSVGHTVVESFLRITNRANGRRVTVFGYGACGKGIALNFRNNHAIVSVVEIDPVARLEALFDGFAVPEREVALADAQIVVRLGVLRGAGPRSINEQVARGYVELAQVAASRSTSPDDHRRRSR